MISTDIFAQGNFSSREECRTYGYAYCTVRSTVVLLDLLVDNMYMGHVYVYNCIRPEQYVVVVRTCHVSYTNDSPLMAWSWYCGKLYLRTDAVFARKRRTYV